MAYCKLFIVNIQYWNMKLLLGQYNYKVFDSSKNISFRKKNDRIIQVENISTNAFFRIYD